MNLNLTGANGSVEVSDTELSVKNTTKPGTPGCYCIPGWCSSGYKVLRKTVLTYLVVVLSHGVKKVLVVLVLVLSALQCGVVVVLLSLLSPRRVTLRK